MKTFLIFSFLFITAGNTLSFAQAKSKEISGKVISFEESFPLKGVTIQTQPSGTATTTAANGVFKLTLSPNDKTLQVSAQGYESKEVKITESAEYNVVLKKAN